MSGNLPPSVGSRWPWVRAPTLPPAQVWELGLELTFFSACYLEYQPTKLLSFRWSDLSPQRSVCALKEGLFNPKPLS